MLKGTRPLAGATQRVTGTIFHIPSMRYHTSRPRVFFHFWVPHVSGTRALFWWKDFALVRGRFGDDLRRRLLLVFHSGVTTPRNMLDKFLATRHVRDTLVVCSFLSAFTRTPLFVAALKHTVRQVGKLTRQKPTGTRIPECCEVSSGSTCLITSRNILHSVGCGRPQSSIGKVKSLVLGLAVVPVLSSS